MCEDGLTVVFADRKALSKRLRKSKLVVIDGPDKGKEFIITKEKVSVGRGKINDFVVTDKTVSFTHFEILTTEKGYLLRDLNSTNGTYFSGCRIKEIYLNPGVIITAGQSKFKFVPLKESVDIPLSEKNRFGDVIGVSLKMREIFAILEKVVNTDLTILLSGETGTGKDIIASSIHKLSHRKDGPFITQDCSAIPRELIESILFGHEKGAFTGATSQHKGSFEQANGGTIFLDEIGELPLQLQPKLLRVLETKRLRRVGGVEEIEVDVRVIAATNRNIKEMISKGEFREDLFFRLAVIHIEIPPLRERKEDIPILVNHFLKQLSDSCPEMRIPRLSPEAMEKLMNYSWPGNVRELRNVIERAVYLSEGDIITPKDLHFPSTLLPDSLCMKREVEYDQSIYNLPFKKAKQIVMEQFEYNYLKALIERNQGNITHSAKEAGLTRFHLRELLKKYGLKSYD